MALLGGMGGGGKSQREGMCVGVWLIHFAVQQRLTQHCKAIILQLKKKIKYKWDILETLKDKKNKEV